ncbi:hypothetical protein D3C71_1619040 [compost metagenome]
MQEGFRFIHNPLRPVYRFSAQYGMSFHNIKFLGRQAAGLQQNMIGNTHLSDVMKRSGGNNQINALLIELFTVFACFGQPRGQFLYV